MPDNMIIYGAVVDAAARKRLLADFPESQEILYWRDDTELFKNVDDVRQVLIDLDDPRFASSEFLMSVASAGEKVKMIGKAVEPDLEETIRLSKFGVAEILSSDQCFRRLQTFLDGNAAAQSKSIQENTGQDSMPHFSIDALVGTSPQVAYIRKTIGLLSEVDFPSALILGETGTGKGLIARILHNTGVRQKHNMVEVNCSAIPDELFESELFGHAKGAFTDAKTEKMGLFEYARQGTLFLDEVGNLSASAQGKLLKILEDRKLRKVGDVNEREINVRVVTATNLDLEKVVEAGTFRSDLYFRLNLLTVEIPPLRERPEDIRPIVEHYIRFYSTLYSKPRMHIADAAIEKMEQYCWPGNVRELCNVIERAILLARKDEIKVKDVSDALQKGRLTIADRGRLVIDIPAQGISLDDIEHQVIKHVLDMCAWNKSEAAKFLKISRPRLRRIIERSGVEQNRRCQ